MLASVGVLVGAWSRAQAQCPDGTPPPCAGQRVVLDPNRIAILPFRVTAADTLLGQGMAELLAPEFTGENGPLAVNVPTVLRTWRRAGGGIRSPLDPAQARRVAAEVGAGRLVDGSIVGLRGTITVTASVTELPGGTVRRVGPLSGPGDSLLALVGRLASGLIGVTGAAPINLQFRLTDSPAAMRAYLDGLARYRIGSFQDAEAAFERAFALDTLFARAALMRMVAGTWPQNIAGWDSVTWKLRDRLSPQDRIMITGQLGEHFPAPRSPLQALADLRRAASLLPQSAEAQFGLGDYLYHVGAAADIADDFASARAQLQLAAGLDPQVEELVHLVMIGFFTGDTALVRRSWTLVQQVPVLPGGTASRLDALGRVVARVLGDQAMEARYMARVPFYQWVLKATSLALLPANEVARLYEGPPGNTPPSSESMTERSHSAINTGRLAWLRPAEPGWQVGGWRDTGSILALSGDTVIAAALGRLSDPASTDAATDPLQVSSLGVIDALRSNLPDLRQRTMMLDSMVRWGMANFNQRLKGSGYQRGLLLSVAWERLGDPARALAAVHLCEWELSVPILLAPRLRLEGRLAATVGDTTRAIRAYHRYLSLRRDADPVLIPERDSVQVALARLERRQ